MVAGVMFLKVQQSGSRRPPILVDQTLKGSFAGIRFPTWGFSAFGGWPAARRLRWDCGLGKVLRLERQTLRLPLLRTSPRPRGHGEGFNYSDPAPDVRFRGVRVLARPFGDSAGTLALARVLQLYHQTPRLLLGPDSPRPRGQGSPSTRLATGRHIAGDSEDTGHEPNRSFCTLQGWNSASALPASSSRSSGTLTPRSHEARASLSPSRLRSRLRMSPNIVTRATGPNPRARPTAQAEAPALSRASVSRARARHRILPA